MARVAIIQRLVPHYRLRFFEKLFERNGWVVCCSRTGPEGLFLSTHTDRPFIRPYDMEFTSESDPYRVVVPVGKILDDLSPDVVVAEFSMRMTSSYELGFRRLLGGPKLIFWSHGYNVEVGIETWHARLRQFPRMALGRCADAHIVYSEAGRNVLASSFPRSRIFVAQNTTDIEEIGEFADPQHSWTPESPSIVSIGRFTPDKRMPLLVEAFAEVLSTYPAARLTLIGDGEDMGAVARAAGKLPDGSVILPGTLYEEQAVAEHLNAADVAVFGGAVGLSVNHVLAYGLPVVAFSETSGGPKHHPEICYVQPHRTGILVNEYNASALSEALLELFCAPGGPRAAYAQSIRDFTGREMNLDLMVEGFESAVSSVA